MTARGPRAVVLAALTLLLATAALTTSAAASDQGSSVLAAPTATAAAAAGDLTVALDSLSPQVLTLDTDLTVKVTVTNSGTAALQTATVSLQLSRFRLTSRTELDAWADGTTGASGASLLARTSLPEPLAAGASATVTLVAPASAFRLANVWGPRGLQIKVDSGSAQTSLRTFLLWESTEQIPQAQVALVAPVVGPATSPTLPTSTTTSTASPSSSATTSSDSDLGALVAPRARLDRLLAAARTVPELGLAVDPALLTEAQSDSTPARTWADGLTAALQDGREALALPWSDPDPAAVGGADAPELLTAARDSSASSYPALSGDLVWSADSQVDASTALVVRESGATRLLLPAAANGTSGVATVSTSAGDLTLLRSDSQLDALATGSTAGSAATQQQALAILAVAARDTAGADRVVIAADRDWSADPAAFAEFVSALRSAPWVRLTTTAALATAANPVSVEATGTADTSDVLPPAQVAALTTARTELQTLARATADPTMVTSGLDDALLAPLAVAWRAEPTARSAQVEATLQAVDARLGALTLTPRANLNVIGASSDVRFTVRNELSTAATVRVQIRAAKPCLTAEISDPVTVAAGTETSIPVHFEAHANCTVKVTAELLAQDGSSLSLSPVVFEANLSPTIENVGTAVVGAVLAVGLLLGIGRTVRRGQSARRGSRQVPPDAPEHLGMLGGDSEGRARTSPPPRPGPGRVSVEPDEGARSSIGGGATVMAAGTLVSRVLGMARNVVLVGVIGATSQAANAFTLANGLPNTMYNLLVSGALSAVLVPQVVRAYKRDSGQDYVDRLLTLGFLLLGLLTLALTAAVPLITRIYGSGHGGDTGGARLALAIALGYWCMPQVFFYGVYALLGQVLNARGSFGPFTWAPAANNVVALVTLGLFAVMYGAHNDAIWPADQWTSTQIAVLGGGATLGIIAQAVVLVPAMRHAGVRWRPRWGFRGVGLGAAGQVASWTFVALLIGQAGAIAVSQAAAAAPDALPRGAVVAGNAAYLSAFMIFMLPHSLVTVSLVTALFPRLSAQAADRAHVRVGETVSVGLRVVGLFTMLAAAIGVVLANILVRAILPTVDLDAVPVIGQVVVAMMLGLPVFGIWSVCQRVYYAYENARSLVPIAIGMAAVVVLGTLAVRLFLPPQLWVVGAALAMTASYVLASVMAVVGLLRRVGHIGGRAVLRVHVRGTVAALAAAGAGAAVLAGLGALGLSPGTGIAGWLLALALFGLVATGMSALYVAVLRALGVGDVDVLIASVRRMLARFTHRPAV
ncbi:MAG: hypothetical protein KJ548_11190 [Actinobacteria bacterium]|nr:hypothetical protein [Actinomycetota bacterium]